MRSKRVVLTHREPDLHHLRCEYCGALWAVDSGTPTDQRKCPERGFHALFAGKARLRDDPREPAP